MTARLDPDVDTAQLDPDVENTARLDPDTAAVEPSVPPRRPRQRDDGSLQQAVRARWREMVRRARPDDNTARLDLDVDKTARLDLDGDKTARLDLDGDKTARLDLDGDKTARLDLKRGSVKSWVPPRRQRQRNGRSLHEAVRARGRGDEVVRRARPLEHGRSFRLNPSVPILGILLIAHRDTAVDQPHGVARPT